MTITEIEERIRGQISGGRLILSGDAVNSPPIGVLLQDELGLDSLPLTDASVSSAGHRVTVRGNATVLSVSSVMIEARVTIVAGSVEMQLVMTLPDGWGLPASFPTLSNTLAGSLNLFKPRLVLSSREDQIEGLKIPLKRGLNCVANVTASGALEKLGVIFDGPFLLHGSISRLSPRLMDIVVDLPDLKLAGVSISDLHVSLTSEHSPEADRTSINAVVEGRVKIGSRLVARISSTLPLLVSALDMRATFTDTRLPSLDDLGDLLGEPAVIETIPQEFRDLTNNLFLHSISLGLDLQARTITYVNAAVVAPGERDLIPGVDGLKFRDLRVDWVVLSPLRRRQMFVEFSGLIGKAGGVELEFYATLPDLTVTAGLASTAKITRLLQQLIPGLPAPDEALEVTELEFIASPRLGTYSIRAEVENVWSFPLDFLGGENKLEIDELSMALDHSPQTTAVTLAGKVSLLEKRFILIADKPARGDWIFSGELAAGDKISLPALVNGVIGKAGGTQIDLSRFGLETLELSDLAFTVDTGTPKSYSFKGALDWDTGIQLTDGRTLAIQATLDIEGGSQPVSGKISGSVGASLPFLEYMSLTVSYAFDNTRKALDFNLDMGTLKLIGRLVKNGDTKIHFSAAQGPTFGEILLLLARLVDPGIEEFHLDSPWNELEAKKLPNITLDINITQKTVAVKCEIEINLFEIISITAINLTYQETRKAGDKTTPRTVLLGFEFGDKSAFKPKPWDALNESAPEVPGQSRALLDVQYLGLGQHVSLGSPGVSQLGNITQVLDALQDNAKPLALGTGQNNPLAATDGAIRFNAASGWLIGAKLTLASALDVSLVFNDPLLYGLRIGLHGDAARIFKGLEFEILYRRISDTIGVYHTELTLPDAMRYLNFGPVALTLPVVVLDIFTNGDFKVDFGFPWNNNFERSFAIEILPFVGAGGFYFNKLSAATATSLIQPTNGLFDPIFEFGVGLRIGLGKTFRRGPLSAEITIAVQGTIEGVISWFNKTGSSDPPEQYYYLQGSVTVVARIYGEVDFEVISVSVEVIARATVRFVVEAFEPILLTLTAEVTVNASVKILFINIKFSFSLSVSESFTIGSHTTPPWVMEGGGSPAKNFSRRSVLAPPALAAAPASLELLAPAADGSEVAPRSVDSAATPQVATLAAPAPPSDASPPPAIAQAVETPSQQVGPLPKLRWEPIPVAHARQSLTLFFQPGHARSDNGMSGVALLFIENSIPVNALDHTEHAQSASETSTDFDLLVLALLKWAIHSDSRQVQTISRSRLEALYQAFTEGNDLAEHPFNFNRVTRFLKENFIFEITDCKSSTSSTIFPMIPDLSIKIGDAPAQYFEQRAHKLRRDRIRGFREYFEQLQVRRSKADIPRRSVIGDAAQLSAAEFVFMEYFALLIRSAIQQAIDRLEGLGRDEIGVENLLDGLNDGGAFNHIAGIASRFLLHGLRLPTGDEVGIETSAIYSVTGQQFLIGPATDISKLALTLGKPAALDWIVFNDSDESGNVIPNAPSLRYLFPRKLVTSIDELRTTPPHLPEARPAVQSPYTDIPLRFPLHRSAGWQAIFSGGQDVAQHTILEFPENLLRRVETEADSRNSFDLKFGAAQRGRAELAVSDLQVYAWATRVPVTIRRIPSADGTGLLTNTYLVVGADESGKDRLEDLWVHAGNNRRLHLYLLGPGSEAGQLVNRDAATCTLLKTNLSAIADEPYSATLSEGRDFVRLLWESSRVNTGGYFLHYRNERNGLSSNLFADGLNATLVLLALLDLPLKPSHPVHSFQNAVVIADRLDLDAGVLFAESAESVKTLMIPPGHIGLRLTRPNASIATATPTAGDELASLYHLLSYRVKGSSDFRASNEGLPVGPLEDDPATRRDDNLWIYERVVPAFSLAFNNALLSNAPSNASELPPAALNPYAGVSPDSSIQMEFQWQDIYGNRLGDAASQSYPVRYVDPLIGINQWPSMLASYWVTAGDDSTATLHVRLVFDHQRFIPASNTEEEKRQKKEEIAAALATYQQIYYQVHQEDLSFALSASMIPGQRLLLTRVEKNRLVGIVDGVCRYLSGLNSNPLAQQPSIPSSLDMLFPLIIRDPQSHELRYPQRLIFPVLVQLVMERDERNVDRTIRTDVPAVQSVTTFLTPQTTPAIAATLEASSTNAQTTVGSQDSPDTLRRFAEHFENGLPGLHLAAGQDRIRNNPNAADGDKQIEKPLWAVHFGTTGIFYNVREEEPFFFAPAPLARTLLSGTAKVAAYNSRSGLSPESAWEDRSAEAIDLNVLARNFLLAVEDFLRPESVVAARAINADAVRAILGHKKTLADAIQGQVTHILVSNDQADLTARREAAVGVLGELLLVNLVEGYDIETIVVFDVEVRLPADSGVTSANRARLYGQPVVSRIKPQVSSANAAATTADFHLSPAKIPLTPGSSHVAFLFDTKTPEKYEDIRLELVYRLNQIECDIVSLGESLAREASSFLSFVLPIDDEPASSMGEIAIPIPLRTYPIPPSLVFQRAEPDPDSRKRLQDVRQWQYLYTYEHPDIAQDTIQTSVQHNVLPPSPETGGVAAQSAEALFSSLVNFAAVYPLLAVDLLLLRQDEPEHHADVLGPALNALEQLIRKVAVAWQARRPSTDAATGADGAAQYQIDETLTTAGKTVTIGMSARDPMPVFPRILLPGFAQSGGPVLRTDDEKKTVTFTFTPKPPEQAALDPVHGESSIPDCTVIIPDLDILSQQNAWAAVWLERNKELVIGTQTNPAFILATPQVRFINAVTPLIINDERWDVAILGSSDGRRKTRSLDEHLLRLFETLLPGESGNSYDIRVAACYAFALATGGQASAGSDLVVRLPVLLQPRFTVPANQNSLEATGQLREDIVDGINAWNQHHHPETRNAMYIFCVSIFSRPGPGADQENSLPLLRIDQLRLQLENVE